MIIRKPLFQLFISITFFYVHISPLIAADFYIGGSAGYSDHQLPKQEVNRASFFDTTEPVSEHDIGILLPTGSRSIDEKGVVFSWKFYGGYKFTQIIGIEAGYIHMGTAYVISDITSIGTTSLTAPLTGTQKTTIDTYSEIYLSTTGFHVLATARVPVSSRLNAFGKIGSIWWDSTIENNRTDSSVISFSGTNQDDTIISSTLTQTRETFNSKDLTVGAGIEYIFTENFGIRGELDFIHHLRGNDNVYTLSLGGFYQFGL